MPVRLYASLTNLSRPIILVSMNMPFAFIGNNLAIDLTNTEVIRDGALIDLLQDKAALLRWVQTAELLVDSRAITTTVLDDALELRSALKNTCSARMKGRAASKKDLATINKCLAHHTTTQVLRCKEGVFALQSAQKNLSPAMLLGYIAHEGAHLLASPQAQRLKRCQNPDCVLVFVDTSRSKKRRWCSMEGCGNRAKVATHYRKTKS